MTEESWADYTGCIGPWEGGGRQSLNYDIGILAANYDPHNVLTCVCGRCGDRYSFDSPTSECGQCERETLIEYLTDENRRLQGQPPLYQKPPRRPRYEVVAAPSFVSAVSELTGEDEQTTRTHMRERGLHLAHARPVGGDRELKELHQWMRSSPGLDYASLSEDKQQAWCDWWATREGDPSRTPTSPQKEEGIKSVGSASSDKEKA